MRPVGFPGSRKWPAPDLMLARRRREDRILGQSKRSWNLVQPFQVGRIGDIIQIKWELVEGSSSIAQASPNKAWIALYAVSLRAII